MAYIEKQDSGCWNWTGFLNPISSRGYFRMNGKRHLAHRASFILFKGSIGKFNVLHKCDNTKCVNPDHLFLGTHLDNMRDCCDKKRNTFGEKVATSKLKERDIVDIFRMTQNRYFSHEELSKMFRVSRTTITLILNNKRWKHLNPEV